MAARHKTEPEPVVWRPWPVSWSGVWIGTLTALAVMVVISLIALALTAHLVGPSKHVVTWDTVGILTLIFSIAGAFFSAVAGGWVAARVAGLRRAEPAMLHGAVSWLVAIPLLLVLTGIGAGSALGGWYGGLNTARNQGAELKASADRGTGGAAAGAATDKPSGDDPAKTADQDEAAKLRNGALGALTALILGLVGSVLGGWLASGEPMHFAHYYGERAAAREEKREPVSV